MAAFIQKKEHMNKQNTTESDENSQCDSTITKPFSSIWKVQKPTETHTKDSLIVEITKQPVESVIPQVDGPLEVDMTDNNTQTSHTSTNDEATQTDDTNMPEPFKGLSGFDYYTLDYDNPVDIEDIRVF